MGRPDQLAKRVLQEETSKVTANRVTVEVPPEVPVGALQPDGVVRVAFAPGLDELDAPWSTLRHEATLDMKMPGDHTGRSSFARCELRRHARWVQHLESKPAPTSPDPRDFAMWVAAPHLPQWLRDDAARGTLTLVSFAPGCWRVGPHDHDALWIAANELPLREDLLPLLIARSGKPLIEFLGWSMSVRGPEWVRKVIQDMRMSADTAEESLVYPDDEAEQTLIKTRLTKRLLECYPAAANEILEKAREEGVEKALAAITRQFERKLARTLSKAEHQVLLSRLDTHGPERLGDVVLDLQPVELDAWLSDPLAP